MYFLMFLICILFAFGVIMVEHGVMNLVRKTPSDRVLRKRFIPPEKFKTYATLRGVAMLVAGIGAILYMSIIFTTYALILMTIGLLCVIYGFVIAIVLRVKYKKKPKDEPL